MIQCSFTEELNRPDGSFTSSVCVQEATILIVNDPCYGLCYACAYNKMKAENATLKEALEHIIEYWNRDENNTAMGDALLEIIETAEQALKG